MPNHRAGRAAAPLNPAYISIIHGGWKSYTMVLRYAYLAQEHLADFIESNQQFVIDGCAGLEAH